MFSAAARATYSIAACDSTMGVCGVAVQTNNLAVGASVPYAKAGVGAIASQFETNPMYGPRGLALLATGKSPEETVQQLIREDGNFGGEGPEARQVGVVSVDGRAAVYTGEQAASSKWAGSRTGNGYSIQGNGLAGPQVVGAMEQAFLNTKGSLAERLMAALTAGDHAGGQTTGRESAAILVSTPAGFPLDIDLRVDHSADPVADLRLLLNIQTARQQIVQGRIAANQGQMQQAKALLISGVSRAPMWARAWIQAASVAQNIEELGLAVQYLNVAFATNSAWAETEIGNGSYPELGADPLFHRWVTADQQNAALAEYQQIAASKNAATDSRVRIASKLLEVGEPHKALESLVGLPATASVSIDVWLLRATAYAAMGDYVEAVNQCRSGLESDPKNARLRLCRARWRTAMDLKGGLQ
jgi:uncharacterized Ntn-hydrolase superfamily protein